MPATAPVKAGNVALRVADVLIEGIASRRWNPGDKLPPEHELAASLGVSRLSVREGMRRVQALGLVRVEHGLGAFVLEPQARQLLPTEALTLIFASPEQAQEVHEARLVLELGLTELAVRRSTAEDLETLDESLRTAESLIERDARPRPELFDLGIEFHLRVAAAAHSPLLKNLYELILEPLVKTVEEPHKRRGNPRDDLAFHRAVVDAIRAKDVAAAVKAMSDHIVKTSAIGHGES